MKKLISFLFLLSGTTTYSQYKVDIDFPQPRSGAAFIFLPEKKSLIMLGGLAQIPNSKESDIWSWDGKVWTRTIAAGPGNIDYSHAIALNRNTGKIFSFAGYDMFDDFKNELWASDGEQWVRSKATPIGGRIHHSMVYADHLGAFVLYGGFNENRENDTTTWLMKNGIFTPLKISGPGSRHQFAMAYDRNRKKVVLYGGTEGSSELWEFDGDRWVKIDNGAINPGTRMRHQMIYDDNLKMVIMHGGDDMRAIPTTWGWDGKSWKKIAEISMYPSVIGYDEFRKVVVAYGQDENAELGIWELQNGKWQSIQKFGKWNTEVFRQQWMKDHPDDVSPLAQISFSFTFYKKYAEAEQGYKKIEEVYPQNMMVLTNIAWVLLKQGKTNEVRLYLQKIDNLTTVKRYLCIRLAIYLREGQLYTESARYFEKALSIEPRGEDYYSLACLYSIMGNKDGAFNNLNIAADNGYNSREQFEKEADLISLKNDARWTGLLKKLK